MPPPNPAGVPTAPATRPSTPPQPPSRRKPTSTGLPPEPPDLEAYAEAGDVVQWYPGADQNEQPHMGIVTQVQIDTKVAVNVVHPVLAHTLPQDGAYHVSHRLATIDNAAGAWKHKPATVALRRLLIAAGVLEWNAARDRLVVSGTFDATGFARSKPPEPPPETKAV